MKWKQQPRPFSQCEGGVCIWAVWSPCFSVFSSVQESMAHEQTHHASIGEYWAPTGSTEVHSGAGIVVDVLHQYVLLLLNKTGRHVFYSFVGRTGFVFSLISGNKTIEEEFAGTPLAPAHSLWTTDAKGSVRLRIEEGCPEEPITIHQMFKESVEKYGNMYALARKRNNKWEKITFLEYYQFCRRAAKSFMKVYYTKWELIVYSAFFLAAIKHYQWVDLKKRKTLKFVNVCSSV